MELCNFYNLDECLNRKLIKKKLTGLEKDGKIEYSIESDVLIIKDIDLDETELAELVDVFDQNDLFPYPDYQSDSDEEDEYGYGDYDSYEEEDGDY